MAEEDAGTLGNSNPGHAPSAVERFLALPDLQLMLAEQAISNDPGLTRQKISGFSSIGRWQHDLVTGSSSASPRLSSSIAELIDIVKDVEYLHDKKFGEFPEDIAGQCASLQFFPPDRRKAVIDFVCSEQALEWGGESKIPEARQALVENFDRYIAKDDVEYRTKIFNAAMEVIDYIGISEALYKNLHLFSRDEQLRLENVRHEYAHSTLFDRSERMEALRVRYGISHEIQPGKEHREDRISEINLLYMDGHSAKEVRLDHLLSYHEHFEKPELDLMLNAALGSPYPHFRSDLLHLFIEKIDNPSKLVVNRIYDHVYSIESDYCKSKLIGDLLSKYHILSKNGSLEKEQFDSLLKEARNLPKAVRSPAQSGLSEGAQKHWDEVMAHLHMERTSLSPERANLALRPRLRSR